jgi:hypothetical protein
MAILLSLQLKPVSPKQRVWERHFQPILLHLLGKQNNNGGVKIASEKR